MNQMKKVTLSFAMFILFSTIVYSAGEFGAGTFDEGNFGFGTPEPPKVESSSTPSGRGGSSGGARSVPYIPEIKEVMINGQTSEISLSQGDSYKIIFKNREEHNLVLNKLYSDRIDIDIYSKKIFQRDLFIGQVATVTFDTGNEISILLKSITGGNANLIIEDLTVYTKVDGAIGEQKIIEQNISDIMKPEVKIEGESEIISVILEKDKEENILSYAQIWSLGFLLLLIIVYFGLYFYYKKRKESKIEKEKEDKKIKEDKNK